MACIGCSTDNGGKPSGCKSNGGCATGGCNRMNTYDWISVLELEDPSPYNFVEVSFKNGSRKEFYKKDQSLDVITGDWVVVETAAGMDTGVITLSGELVRLQMKKKNWNENRVIYRIVRKANDRDIDHMQQARDIEKHALVKGRAIARSLGLEMKLGDIEYQSDLRKATFFYTADRRIDFRELVKQYAKEFRIKIEMRQIGARQESARIGGIGSCGRELCCSTWLSDFKTVVTSAARYQNLAINQAKLSGQCGRLKCCLNYELDVYMESLERFPMDIEELRSKIGTANLLKTDIFKGIMYYELTANNKTRETIVFGMSPESVRTFKARNDRGELPADFGETISLVSPVKNEEDIDKGFADVTGEIELPEEKRKKKKKNKNKYPGEPSAENQAQLSRPQNNNENRPPKPNNQTNSSNHHQPRNHQNQNKPNQENKNQPPNQQRSQHPNQYKQPYQKDRNPNDQRNRDQRNQNRSNQNPNNPNPKPEPPKES